MAAENRLYLSLIVQHLNASMVQEAASATSCFEDLFLLLFVCMYLCVYTYHLRLGAHRGHKGALDPLELELQACVGAGNQISGLLEEQQVPLTDEPSLQPPSSNLLIEP